MDNKTYYKRNPPIKKKLLIDSLPEDTCFEVVGEYKRLHGSSRQEHGLISKSDYGEHKKHLYHGSTFYKLLHNGKYYFAKKPEDKEMLNREYENIIKAYSILEKDNLIDFYGYSEEYGLIFEWIDNFQYIDKTSIKSGDIHLQSVDVIEVQGQKKYIDFEI